MYIHERKNWPELHWDTVRIASLLAGIRYRQGRLIGQMEALGFALREESELQILTHEVIKSSEIEGEILNAEQVRSSLARRLGIELTRSVQSGRDVEGMVDMMLDATLQFDKPLRSERLFGWQAGLFPSDRRSSKRLKPGTWRTGEHGPMQVVSGKIGKEIIHFEAPGASKVPEEMRRFLTWFNAPNDDLDPVLKAGIAHLWFVTIHPFSDGNGRIARAIANMQLARADDTQHRFYSMSSQIRKERNDYYQMLETTQKGSLDITAWLTWFLQCLDRAFMATHDLLANVFFKARFWEKHAQAPLNERQRIMVNRMLEGVEGKMTSSKWAKMAKCSSDTAVRDIQDLIEKGLVVKEIAGGRSTSYELRS